MSKEIFLPHTNYSQPQYIDGIRSTPLLVTDVISLIELTGAVGDTLSSKNGVEFRSNMYVLEGEVRATQEAFNGNPTHTEVIRAGEYSNDGDDNWHPGAMVQYECTEDVTWRCLACAPSLTPQNSVYDGLSTIEVPASLSIVAFLGVETSIGNGNFALRSDEAQSIEMSSGWAWLVTGITPP